MTHAEHNICMGTSYGYLASAAHHLLTPCGPSMSFATCTASFGIFSHRYAQGQASVDALHEATQSQRRAAAANWAAIEVGPGVIIATADHHAGSLGGCFALPIRV